MRHFIRHLVIITSLLLFSSCKNKTFVATDIKTDKTKAAAYKKLELNKDTNHYEGKIVKFTSKYRFENFKTKVYTGSLVEPKLTDKELSADINFVKYITEACKDDGINFSGHYTILQSSCGAMCEGLYIVDRRSGKVFFDLKPNNGERWGCLYKKDSRMLIANSNALDDSLKYYSNIFDAPEVYAWTGKTLKQLQ